MSEKKAQEQFLFSDQEAFNTIDVSNGNIPVENPDSTHSEIVGAEFISSIDVLSPDAEIVKPDGMCSITESNEDSQVQDLQVKEPIFKPETGDAAESEKNCEVSAIQSSTEIQDEAEGEKAGTETIVSISAVEAEMDVAIPDDAINLESELGDTIQSIAQIKKTIEPVSEKVQSGFDCLELSEDVKSAVKASGYTSPTPIQAEIIPHMLNGRDVLAQSQTGTGKTAAFALPILSLVDTRQKKPQVLVLAPTRELAIQVAKSFTTYSSKVKGFAVAAIYGGQDYEPQLKQLRRGVQVVVGTPGRVIDHIKRGTLELDNIRCLVLDEADEMLNMGFLEDVEFVLEQAPQERQIALFSATLPGPIRGIAQKYLHDPAKITIKKKTMTADSIRQRALIVPHRDKIEVLSRILEAEETDGVIVFTKTKEATISVCERLVAEGLSAIALNGDMPQKTRERAIEKIKAGHYDILVATDVAARGLDVTRISHVFNFDLPHDSESYIHRVGRTGRAGRAGEAVLFLTSSERHKLRFIERATKQPIEIVEPPSTTEINAARIRRFKQSIAKTMADKDLTFFSKLIAEHVEESGAPFELVAAALAEMGQQGRPFLMRDLPKRKERDRSGRGARNDRRDRSRNSRDFGANSERPRRGRKNDGRRLGPPEPGMNRYRIEVGANDGVKPGNIVGAVANEAGIDGQYIGPIKIEDNHSTIDLPDGMPHDMFQTLQQTWVAGKKLNISLRDDAGDGGHDERPRPARHGGNSGGMGRGGRRSSRSSDNRNSEGQSTGRSEGGGHAKYGNKRRGGKFGDAKTKQSGSYRGGKSFGHGNENGGRSGTESSKKVGERSSRGGEGRADARASAGQSGASKPGLKKTATANKKYSGSRISVRKRNKRKSSD